MANAGQDPYSHADPGSAGQYPPPHDARHYPPATPTTGGYHEPPSSARSSNFPYDSMSRQHQYTPGSSSANPAMSAVQSPTYPYPYPQAGHPDMNHYAGSAPTNYGPWPGYGHPNMAYSSPGGPHSQVTSPVSAGPPRAGQQVYSFVPIPGAAQHKRPRRRYEEIERMYKCGFQGCEKAYGTLNHLNAHVTMQSHGSKRTPEEFKEIRKEWKARKKEEENNRKADEERQRQASMTQASGPVTDSSNNGSSGSATTATPTTPGYPQSPRGPQLPPIGYNNAGNAVGSQYPGPSADPNIYGGGQQGQMFNSYNYSHPETSASYTQ